MHEPVLRIPVEVDLGDTIAGLGPAVLRGRVVLPEDPETVHTLAVCHAGGRCSVGYHDLQVVDPDGVPVPGYSLAAHLATAGMAVLLLDHPGVGASDLLPDIFAATPTRVAAAHHAALETVRARLAEGTLAPGVPELVPERTLGIGHSMGGMLLDVQQARHRSFDAVVGLGHSGDGLPAHLHVDELALAGQPLRLTEDRIAAAARARFGQATNLLFSSGLTSMIPASTHEEKAAIDVPVLIALGDRDLVRDLPAAAAHYTAADDITLLRLRATAHCHNQEASRTLLWERIVRWFGDVTG
ncbi:MAG: alpha/beta hydrolase [Acidimicrobiales bacterium]|nr:alpha/beta hydrolase [Acidimicrobiales bacterium]